MLIVDQPPRYCSYLLRCWEERTQHRERPRVWRYSLENPHTGERRGFPSIDALLTFLRAETCGELAAPDEPAIAEGARVDGENVAIT